jgi:ABC-2 type transport system permease protein
MHNLWLVAKQEYKRVVGRRSFLALTLAIPLALVTLIGLAILIETSGQSQLPIGYVDPTGLLDPARFGSLPDAHKRVGVREFDDQAAALAALEREQVQAVFVLPANYPQTVETRLYYLTRPPGGDAWRDFDDFVRLNLLAGLPDPVQQRLLAGPSPIVEDVTSGRQFSEGGVANIVLPLVMAFFFFFATMTAAGSMLGVVASEKENRTMEVLVTSVTPGQLIGGKTVGLLAASLTQLAIYLLVGVAGILVARPYVPQLQILTVPWGLLGIVALFFLPAFALSAGIMVSIGAAVTEVQQGQQIGGLLNLLFMLPLLLLVFILQNPNGPLPLLLTLFPPTSFLTVSLRWGLGSVPSWQMVVSWVLLVGSAVTIIWVASRIFRAGMLRYGQPLSVQAALAAVRGE